MTRAAVVDLPRARAALDALERTILDNPDPAFRERTRAFLAGELPAGGPAMRSKPAPFRVSAEALARADALLPYLAELPALAGEEVTRSMVLRLALTRGLAALEAEAATARKGRHRS